MKMEPGIYDCKTTAATIYEAPSGAVMCRVALDLGLTGGICLIQKDGTLSERGFKNVQTILGLSGPWDWDVWAREPEEWAGHDVEAVVETINGEHGEFSSVKYLNPPGGGSAALLKPNAKELAAKYGAKTRALFGGTPAAPKPAPPAPPAPPAQKTLPMPGANKPSTMEDCWDAFCKYNDGKDEADLYVLWPKAIADATGGKGQHDCTPADWGAVMASIDNLPY